MVDLKGQYAKIKKNIDQAIEGVLNNANFIKGPEVAQFKKELQTYLPINHVIPCANGTDALQIALMALGLQAGDEIITPNFTFIATVEVIALLGLKPVIVDVEPDTFNIDPVAIERAVTQKTKGIVPVHLFGLSADMKKIMKLAKTYNLKVIEDTAQAISTHYTNGDGSFSRVGTIGHIGCTSFFPSKNLGCYGDGGAVYTNDDLLAEKMNSIANHGMKVRYYHDDIGINSRLDSIQAAVLSVKIKYLDMYNHLRQKAAAFYDEAFKNQPEITVPYRPENSTHTFHQYTIKVHESKRDLLKAYLESKNIPAMVYYPVPMHHQKAFKHLGYQNGDFPVTEKLCKQVLSLPMHTELDNEQLEYITSNVLNFFK